MITIPDMKMPESCWQCCLCGSVQGDGIRGRINICNYLYIEGDHTALQAKIPNDERHPNCPLCEPETTTIDKIIKQINKEQPSEFVELVNKYFWELL